jgi:hypothetical protein
MKIAVNWNKLNKQEKLKVLNNPQNYFVMVDIKCRIKKNELKGLPIFNQ